MAFWVTCPWGSESLAAAEVFKVLDGHFRRGTLFARSSSLDHSSMGPRDIAVRFAPVLTRTLEDRVGIPSPVHLSPWLPAHELLTPAQCQGTDDDAAAPASEVPSFISREASMPLRLTRASVSSNLTAEGNNEGATEGGLIATPAVAPMQWERSNMAPMQGVVCFSIEALSKDEASPQQQATSETSSASSVDASFLLSKECVVRLNKLRSIDLVATLNLCSTDDGSVDKILPLLRDADGAFRESLRATVDDYMTKDLAWFEQYESPVEIPEAMKADLVGGVVRDYTQWKKEEAIMLKRKAAKEAAAREAAVDNSDTTIDNAPHVAQELPPSSTAVVDETAAVQKATLVGFERDQGTADREPITFRATTVRRCESKGITSSQISQEAGGAIGDLFNWNISMRFYNLDVVSVHEGSKWIIGAALTPTAMPAGLEGKDIDEQFAFEAKRRELGVRIAKGTAEDTPEIRKSVAHPSTRKDDVRRQRGENAMHPALGHVLVELADIGPDDVVCDPMAGCGSIIVESALSSWAKLSAAKSSSAIPTATRAAEPSVAETPFLLGISGDMALVDAKRQRDNHVFASYAFDASRTFGLVTPDQPASGPVVIPKPVLHHKPDGQACAEGRDQEGDDDEDAPTRQGDHHQQGVDVNAAVAAAKTAEGKRLRRSHFKGPQAPLPETVSRLCEDGWLPTTAFRWDARHLPMRGGTVDAVVTDMPFGHRCGNHSVNAKLYPALVREFRRVLRDGGRCVLLTAERSLLERVLVGSTCQFKNATGRTLEDFKANGPTVFEKKEGDDDFRDPGEKERGQSKKERKLAKKEKRDMEKRERSPPETEAQLEELRAMRKPAAGSAAQMAEQYRIEGKHLEGMVIEGPTGAWLLKRAPSRLDMAGLQPFVFALVKV